MAQNRAQPDACRPNTPETFAVVYEQNYARIFGYVYRRILHWETAEDITAEVFLKAFKSFWRFRWTSIPITAWFYRIATNEVNMYFRAGKVRHGVPLAELLKAGFDLPDARTAETEKLAAELEVERSREFLAIQKQVRTLATKYQTVMALRYFEGRNVREIAQILGKREGTVKSLLSRALDQLRKKLPPNATE